MPQPAVPQPKKFVYLKSGWPVALLEFVPNVSRPKFNPPLPSENPTREVP